MRRLQRKKPILVSSSFPLYNNTLYNTEEKKIESAINSSDWVLLNDGNHTWSSPDLKSLSAIDLILSSNDIASKCTWKTLDYNLDSDHYPIIINVKKITTSINYTVDHIFQLITFVGKNSTLNIIGYVKTFNI